MRTSMNQKMLNIKEEIDDDSAIGVAALCVMILFFITGLIGIIFLIAIGIEWTWNHVGHGFAWAFVVALALTPCYIILRKAGQGRD